MFRKFASGIALSLLLITVLIWMSEIQPVEASGTIYIRADGSIYPSTSNISSADNVHYYLTGNIHDEIVVQKSNIIIDGNGYALQGSGGGNGLYLCGMSGVTVKNTTIMNFYAGIYLNLSTCTNLSCNNITRNEYSIYLLFSSNNTISRNSITNNEYSIYLEASHGNAIYRNLISDRNQRGGPYLHGSSDNIIYGNYIDNSLPGGTLDACGIYLSDSPRNSILGNNISNSEFGIWILNSSDNTCISGNYITNTSEGLLLYSSSYNVISENNIVDNNWGISVREDSFYNKFYHNNLINNGPWYIDPPPQVSTESGLNSTWDDGYPSGGNFWSDYNGTDLYSGHYQNETGSDGIGDTPYVIDENNTDNYPLMQPYHCQGPVRNLNTGQSYPTIQEGINNASENDRIFVLSGTYYENVFVDKTLSLIGESKDDTIIDGGEESPDVMHVAANKVVISRFTVQNSSQALGIAHAGIRISGFYGCRIFNNKFEDNKLGILVDRSENSKVARNVFIGNGHGIALSESSEVTVVANNFTGNTIGITISGSSFQNTIVDNHIARSSSGGHGIYISNSFNNTIQDNDITENYHGMWLSNSFNNLIVENTIADNILLGIEIANSTNNISYHNKFINNPRQVKIGNQNNINIWDNGCEGNYWSDYNGTDSDEDGIGDSPYIINENNTDRYPLMNLYWNPCDINHDLTVDMRDIGTAAKAFGTEPGDERWNCHADITGPAHLEPDGQVDMRDISLIARYFGETYQ